MTRAINATRMADARRLILKLVRFGLVGGASTVLYALLTWQGVESLGLRPTLAAALSYALLIPPNFIAHKYFTFGSEGNVGRESGKFVLVHALNLGLSVAGMAVIEWLGADYRIGIATSTVAVPVIVFLLMNSWVFRSQQVP